MTVDQAKLLKPGDRICDNESGVEANVLGLNANGFEYEYDAPIPFIPRWNMTFTGGTCYWNGVEFWTKVSK